MRNNGVEVVHFATGFLVGYPPCPWIDYFKNFIEEKYGLKVVFGTHPVPQKYYTIHKALGTWDSQEWEEYLEHIICDEKTRKKYD